MKKTIPYLVLCALAMSPLRSLPVSYVDDDEVDNDVYETVGLSTTSANFDALSSSMVAWGIGLAAGITLLTIIIEPSEAESSSSSSSSSGSSSHAAHTH